MDSSPDLSVKLRRGSSDSRDSFYMGFAQGIDSDIEEVTTVQNVPQPPPPPLYPAPEEPPIELPIPVNVTFESEELVRVPTEEIINVECVEQQFETEEIVENVEIIPEITIEYLPPLLTLPDDDEDETNTSVTVIQSKHKTPSSSSSSISSSHNELMIEETEKFQSKPPPLITESPPTEPKSEHSEPKSEELSEPKSQPQSPLSEPKSPLSERKSPLSEPKSPPSEPKSTHSEPKSTHSEPRSTHSEPKSSTSEPKSAHSEPKSSHSEPHSTHSEPKSMSRSDSKSSKSLSQKRKTPTPPPPLQMSPPKRLDFYRDSRQKNFDSDSIDSINAIDCKIDDDNRDDSSPTDSMPPIPTPPPLGYPLSLGKSGIMEASQALVPSPSSPDNAIVSPETLSHHSSPAKSSRVLHYAQHVTTIDESRLPSSLRSSNHQLLEQSRRSTPSSPPPPFQSGPMTPAESQAMVPHRSSATKIDAQMSRSSPTSPIQGTSTTTQHLSVLYQTHHHLHPIITSPTHRPSRLPDTSRFLAQQQALALAPPPREIKALDAFCTTLSALYGKILVVMGIAFPMAEVISTYIPPSFYEVFYLYLYIGSMLFLLFMYATLLWGSKPSIPVTTATTTVASQKQRRRPNSSSSDSGDQSDHEESESSEQSMRKSSKSIIQMRRPSILAAATLKSQHYGSFYLRMGAVAFGIGSMIYSGLEFGQYFELERDTKCHNVLLALTPATRMAFIFIQMYFIFLNNEQIKVYRHKILARFGLMHMIGTNLSVWFSVLIQETKHEILTFYDPENRTLKISHRLGNKVIAHALEEAANAHSRVTRGLKGPHNIFECRRSNILGTLVQDASPFLFPCTIEYSLICAAILYVMWRNISRPHQEPNEIIRPELHPFKRSPHHYSVDCAGAHKGLFIGILILVLTIISLILFFVLISKPEFTHFAVTEVNICELALYGTTIVATLVGMIQVRVLHYDSSRSFSLDDILLVGAQTGSFLYSTFTIIGAHLTLKPNTILILITAMASLVETAFQTMFILDASRRSAAKPDHVRKKPGREIVTFLLVSNLAMWAINTLEKSRAESHPLQLHFYGLWAWTIITHVSMPLAIFYRFHSTVCLCDIWKRAWKMKPTYM